MAAFLVDDLSEGVQFAQDPDSGRITYTLTKLACDLDEGAPIQLIAQALGMVPARGTPGPVGGTYLRNVDPEPSPPRDCLLRLNYASPQWGDRVGDPPRIRVQTACQQLESDFDAANRAKPIGTRQIATVTYDPAASGAPASANAKSNPRLPYYAAKSARTYRRRLSADPQPLADRYVSFTNSDTWKGYAPNTLLMFSIDGESDDYGNTWVTEFVLLVDAVEKFQVAERYVDPVTGQSPTLKDTQVQAGNGIKIFTVQGAIPFTPLPL